MNQQETFCYGTCVCPLWNGVYLVFRESRRSWRGRGRVTWSLHLLPPVHVKHTHTSVCLIWCGWCFLYIWMWSVAAVWLSSWERQRNTAPWWWAKCSSSGLNSLTWSGWLFYEDRGSPWSCNLMETAKRSCQASEQAPTPTRRGWGPQRAPLSESCPSRARMKQTQTLNCCRVCCLLLRHIFTFIILSVATRL